MFIKQISQEEALQLASKGQDIMVMVPSGDEDGNEEWKDMFPDTLQNILSGIMFFRKEPALENINEESTLPPPKQNSRQDLMEKLRKLQEAPKNQPPTVWLPVPNGKRE